VVLYPISSPGAVGNGVEVKTFGLLDVDADFSVGYVFDDWSRGSSANLDSFEQRATWEERLYFKTRSYVYHPAFLSIFFDAGPKLLQQQYDSNAGANSTNDTFWDVYARLNFFEFKPYPFYVYYAHSNPAVRVGTAGRYLTEQNRHGFKANILSFLGVGISLDLQHVDTQGSGFGRFSDEDMDTAEARFTKLYRGSDFLELRIGNSTRDSASGSPGLPIQRTLTRQNTMELNARNYFGSEDDVTVNQTLRRLQQEQVSAITTEFDSWRYSGNIRLRKFGPWTSSIVLNADRMDRESSQSRSRGLAVSASRSFYDNLSAGLGASTALQNQTGFERDSLGLNGYFSYQKTIGSTTLFLGGRSSKTRSKQISTADTVQVFDEPLTLTGTNSVDLANEFVVAGSVTVTNESQTQQYVEGLDYRLVIIGSVTGIQRLIDGNILDGETVLVDYEFQTSGTAEFDTVASSLNVSANFLRYARASLAFSRRRTDVTGGALTTPVNDADNIQFSIGADKPFGNGWSVSGDYRYLDRKEDIAPSVSNFFSLHISKSFSGSLKLWVSGSYRNVEQEFSTEDTDQVQYRFGFSGRLLSRVRFNYSVDYLEDLGGSLPRDHWQHRFRLDWQFRDVMLYVQAATFEESLGEKINDSTHVTAKVTRFFR
jgi:hypothetical protein